jgi:glycosyltransferase involved in cell wall biosynthesis
VKLLALTSTFPYPPDGGSKAVLAGFLEYAVTTLGSENVVLLCVSSVREEVDAQHLAPCDVIFFSPASTIWRGLLVALKGLILRKRAIQEMLTAVSWAAARRVCTAFDAFAPDIVLVDTIRVVQHLPRRMRRVQRRVLYMDDLYSLRYSRMLSSMDDYPEVQIDPLGTFRRFVPGPLRGLPIRGAVQRWLLKTESAILARREAAMPMQFDQVLLVNPGEAVRLAHSSGATNVSSVVPLLRRASRPGPAKRCFAGDPTFLFLGNLRVPANAHGLSLFLRHSMPLFLSRVPTGRLIVVGVGGSRELCELGGAFGQHVSFAGYVEDLDPLCCSAAGMVIPLVFGTGLKTRVIEALACGLPIISTSCGIDGFDLEPGRHCYVKEDIAGFADAMVRLLDPALNAALTRHILACYKERFSPDAVSRSYRAVLLGDGAASGDPHCEVA